TLFSAHFAFAAIQQHFTAAPTPGWSVTGGSVPSITQDPAPAVTDTRDSSTANGFLTSGFCSPCSVDLTYTDPAPDTVANQRYVFVDIYPYLIPSLNVQMAVSCSVGGAVT